MCVVLCSAVTVIGLYKMSFVIYQASINAKPLVITSTSVTLLQLGENSDILLNCKRGQQGEVVYIRHPFAGPSHFIAC